MKITFRLDLEDIKQALAGYLNSQDVTQDAIDPTQVEVTPFIRPNTLQLDFVDVKVEIQ